MSVEDNKKVVFQSWEESANAHNPEAFDRFYAVDCVYHGPDGEVQGVAAMKELVAGYIKAFPDIHVTVEDAIGEGDKVACRLVARGTNTGDLQGMPATGKSVTLSMIQIVRIANGKIAEEWESFNQMEMMQQLGLAD